jgi:prepilin-type N-terminal cleavage/methylation domain-containing protein
MKKQLGFTIVEILVVVLVLVGGTGWVWNVVKIVGSDFGAITGMLVMRVIGVFVAPLGCVLGFL